MLDYSSSDVMSSEEGSATINEGSITFDSIGIHYKTEKTPIIKNLSLHINKGETIAIVGPTGSGKSSLLNLIPRLYEPTEGDLLIDNKSIKNFSKKELRRQIGVVFQVNDLFTGTIAENLRWGKLDATDEELKQVSKIAQIDDFISQLAKGYDTKLGRNGINLSGGQRQRLCIARALLNQPKILILDDCTSALDAHTEIQIWNNLKKLPYQVTTLMVTQRVTTLSHVDKILLLNEKGEVSYDTPENTLNNSAYFKQLYKLQTQL